MLTTRYSRFSAITPSNTVDLDGSTATAASQPVCCDAILVGGAGVIAAVDQGGTVTNITVVAGQEVHIRARRVNATNTTATQLIALYE